MAKNVARLIAPVLLGALILLFPADGLRALGLGEARVDSWLGQPLDVSIRLLEIEDEAIESVSVGPASLEDFERLNVPSDSLGLGLEVTVDRRSQPPTVRVRSQQPVSDPVVQILIDARWSSGRVLREYTLFLDPPVMDSQAPVRRVSQDQAQPESTPEPAPQRQEPAAEPEPVRPAPQRPAAQDTTPSQPASPQPAPAGSVRVQRGDTLWSIAQEWRPNTSMTMDQVMLAIFNRNRNAFLGENINRLRSDALLDMPDMGDVQSMDRAEARRLVREQMRSWQPGVVEDVPVVSDAAMPDSAAPSEATDEAEDATTAEASDSEDFRLDVVPPEEEQYSESSAVPEGEIQRVSDQLSDVQEQIAAEGLQSESFEDHVSEVRDALDQRDMAGLAVAEESLAELETRLREAREARAEQERMAQAVDDQGDNASGETDEIEDYMSELEREFGAEDGEQASGDETAMAGDATDGSATEPSGSGDDPAGAENADAIAQADASEQDNDAAATTGAEAEDSAETSSDEQPMTVTRTSSGSQSWLGLALGALALILVAAGAFWMLSRRRQESERAEPGLGAGDAVDSAYAAVRRNPDDLGAHLALLKLLGDEGREQEFTDAFDQMYQEVDDESAPEWQEALSLAAAHVPDHPLLTPHETALDDGDDFHRREDDMLGMLDTEEDDDEAIETEDDDDPFDLSGERIGESNAEAPGADAERDDKEDTFDNDMDLAVLSERLDDPSKEPGRDKSLDEIQDDSDFREFKEIDEYSTESEPDEHSEASVDLEDDTSAGLDLDFDPAREQESDEVVGESGTRESEDLDFDLSSDLEESADGATDAGLDFDLGEDESTTEPDEAAEEAELEDLVSDAATPGAADEDDEADSRGGQSEDVTSEDETAEPAAEESSGGGHLSDEDADVKLDLARAYISVDLADSARSVLEEVVSDGSDAKREEAQKLLDDLD